MTMSGDNNETTVLTNQACPAIYRTHSLKADSERHSPSQTSQPCSSTSFSSTSLAHDGDSDGPDGPDGGFWAWIVVLGSFMANGIIFGVINCYGVLFEEVQRTYASGESATFLTCKYLTGCDLT